ncbi:nucleoside triphosphate pyrophosphohydrolase [compost metagenome]
MQDRPLHPVSAKAILYSLDSKEVLVMQYLWEGVKDQYGFPGGHLEHGENPDEAILREIKEELGIVVGGLSRGDFWVHESGKVILAYVGSLDKATPLHPSRPEGEIGIWASIEDIESRKIDVGSYRDLVLARAENIKTV